jgi:hexulose-6-phosphate isomerase
MVIGIQQPSGIGEEHSLFTAAQAAKQAGFQAFEPILAETGLISITAEEKVLRGAGEMIRTAGLTTLSAACPIFERIPLSSQDPVIQARARAFLVAGLDRASWLGATLLTVHAGRITDLSDVSRLSTPYAEALNGLHLMLEWIAPEAEIRGVVIGLQSPGDRFLLSPVEVRDLVDGLATPWIQVCVDTAAVQRFGFPGDWIETLGPRIGSIHAGDCRGGRSCPLGEGDVDWPAVAAAIKGAQYTGPVICVQGGEPGQCMSRLAGLGF